MSCSLYRNLPSRTRSTAKVWEFTGCNVTYPLDLALNRSCLGGIHYFPSQLSDLSVNVRSSDGSFLIGRMNLTGSGQPKCVEPALKRSTTWEKYHFSARRVPPPILLLPPNRMSDIFSRSLPLLERRHQLTNLFPQRILFLQGRAWLHFRSSLECDRTALLRYCQIAVTWIFEWLRVKFKSKA